MKNWIHKVFYKITIDELNVEKAKEFAANSIKNSKNEAITNLYDRYSYSNSRREEAVCCGKLAEEAFSIFLNDCFNVKLEVNYDVYEGAKNVDNNDFVINDLEFDIKSSKDTQNRGLYECYKYFNFPVPMDQNIKDITVSVLYDYNITEFWIVAWIEKEKYLKKYKIGHFKEENCDFYKFPLKEGNVASELAVVFLDKQKLKRFLDSRK